MLPLDALWQTVRESMIGPLRPRMTRPSLDDDAPAPWQLSSFELMDGVEVTDVSNAISGEAFNELFARGDR